MDELEAREPEMKGEDGGKTKGVNTFVISIPVYDACHLCFPHSLSVVRGITHTQLFKKLSVTFVDVCTHSSAPVFMFAPYANSYNMPLIYYLYQYKNV